MTRERPGTSVDRTDDEVTLVGHESEDQLTSDGIPWGLLERPRPLDERRSSVVSRRHGTRIEEHRDHVLLRGEERADQMRKGIVVALSPYESDGGHEPS